MLNVKIRRIEEIKELLSGMPKAVRAIVNREAAYYLVGNESRGLQHYPPRANHGEGNPYQWASDKQRKAFFASDGFGGGIPSRRTNDLRFGWQIDYSEGGVNATVSNDVPYAEFVQGDDNQQAGHAADGWRTLGDIIASNIDGMIQAAERAVERFLSTFK